MTRTKRRTQARKKTKIQMATKNNTENILCSCDMKLLCSCSTSFDLCIFLR